MAIAKRASPNNTGEAFFMKKIEVKEGDGSPVTFPVLR